MAIAFARVEFVKRTDGRNACQKSAYMGRQRIAFHGNVVLPSALYDWTHKGKSSHHEVLLPNGVDPRYLSCETLWNAVEAAERRKNSQVAVDVVLALPDDSAITLEDRIELARSFVREHFTDKGLAAQLDIHAPEKMLVQENGKTVVADHNWHAHVLATTRRFTQDGLGLGEKARDLMPKICRGKVVEGVDWGKAWGEHQNRFFKERGMALRVDPTGVVSQLHLGPVRMRGRAYSLFEEQALRVELNELESRDPTKILEKITETRSTFAPKEVDLFLGRFVSLSDVSWVREAFWSQAAITPLLDASGKSTGRFTSQKVFEEERRTLRVASRLNEQTRWLVSQESIDRACERLNEEQQNALRGVIDRGGLSCIDGHAGTGKSRVLLSLRQAYEEAEYEVRAFGADNATSQELKDRGFDSAENIYRFLFAARHGHRDIRRGGEVWLLDEAGKIGTQPLLELLRLARKSNVKVVLAGSQAQMSSVARGSMFAEICQRLGSFSLEDIQRQLDQSQRAMARSLATGEVGCALDRLEQLGGLRWSGTREEAMEDLVTQWATDRALFPKERSLIIAHSNQEVRVLNEMIHSFRHEQGELGDREFECQTSRGKCWISTGDLIEFRRNSKELGVTNGMRGALIEASPEQLIVGVRSDSGLRRVAFDPREYSCFQLGYATTYYRSQGRTVDRAYVLHSRSMDRPMFYVGLTRHVRHAECFLSRENVSNLADLRRQLYRQPSLDSTLPYTSPHELEKERSRLEQAEHRQKLADSPSLWDRFRGAGLEVAHSIRERSSSWIEGLRDHRLDRRFYSVPKDKESVTGFVSEYLGSTRDQPASFLQEQLRNATNEARNGAQVTSDNMQQKQKISWKSLTENQRASLRAYFDASEHASSLWTLLQEGKGDHQQAFRQACGERNERAAIAQGHFTEQSLARTMSRKACEVLSDRADRHRAQIEARTNASAEVQQRLLLHLEPLIYRLFPDGPSWKDQSTFRFGAKGSLSIRHSGPKAGSFYDFENKCGGGLLQLIQREKGLDRREALQWAREFLGSDLSQRLPSSFRAPITSPSKDREWIAQKPPDTKPAPSFESISRKLSERFSEAARYCYQDETGAPLFYTLRLEERSDPSRKQVLPLSYGSWVDGDGTPKWAIKGYSAQNRPLFNLDQLTSNPNAQVLVVEGEKTVCAAARLEFDRETVCVTWCGGASAVSKSDWSPLKGRDVIVWPDNDQAGFKAADLVCSELRCAGAKSVKQVSPTLLRQNLPEKWDLADALPRELPEKFVRDALLGAHPKSVELASLVASMSQEKQQYPERMLREILCCVEDRLRSQLEDGETNKLLEVQGAILKEAQRVLKESRELVASSSLVDGSSQILAERLTYRTAMHIANTGALPTEDQLGRLRTAIRDEEVAIKREKESSDSLGHIRQNDMARESLKTGHELDM